MKIRIRLFIIRYTVVIVNLHVSGGILLKNKLLEIKGKFLGVKKKFFLITSLFFTTHLSHPRAMILGQVRSPDTFNTNY